MKGYLWQTMKRWKRCHHNWMRDFKPAGVSDSLEWQTGQRVRAFRDISSQYRYTWQTKQHFIETALFSSSLTLPSFGNTWVSLHFPGSFPCDSHVVAVHGENLYTVEPNRVQIRTPQVCSPILAATVQYLLKHSLSKCLCVNFLDVAFLPLNYSNVDIKLA